MAKYDLDLVKSAASGRWSECFTSVAGVSIDLLDGKHHGCPKCGGSDRFRLIDPDKGACICNQCFTTKNGDGFATVQWLLGCDFKTALTKIADHFGVAPEKGKKELDPASDLDFLPWNATLVGMWCQKKQPIKPESVKAVGGQVARYRRQYTVIAIPVHGSSGDHEKPVGWILYRADGGELPLKVDKDGNVSEWVKVKLTAGSRQGYIGSFAGETVWKVEGSTDLLALISAGIPEGHTAFTTANGATEKPLPWIVHACANKSINVVHDADKPGQQGATFIEQHDGQKRPGWCPSLAGSARVVKNITLPFPIEETHGPDLRDYFNGGGTIETLLARVDEAQEFTTVGQSAQSALVEEADDDPHRLARINLHKYRQAGRDLRMWRGEWYRYRGDRYERISRSDLENRINESIKEELDRIWLEKFKKDTDKAGTVRKVTTRLVSDVIKATGGMSYLRSNQELNSWIDGGPEDCIAMRNGILCLSELFSPNCDPSKVLLPHSPRWFSTTALSYDFDETAQCPTWIQFLDDVFNRDHESITALQKWFGYLLLPDTSLQKMLFVIGRARSGKGTILRTIQGLFGKHMVATPTLKDLADEFGLQTLTEKTIATIADARLSHRSDEVAITERLLSITGEDPQDVRRKYLDTLHGVRVPVRFTLFSNMLPKLSDSSAAFMTRCIFLNMPNTYVGREDKNLGPKIHAEFPGVLNWAIAGRYLLSQDGRIEQPASGLELMHQLKAIISPVAMFIEECCKEEGEVEPKDLFDAWCDWARENGIHKKWDVQNFAKNVRDVLPGISDQRIQTDYGRKRIYRGISLVK